MVEYVDACNGCPDCIGCGRKGIRYRYISCDVCGSDIGESEIYGRDGLDMCWDCYNETENEVE